MNLKNNTSNIYIDSSYLKLPAHFYEQVVPTPVKAPYLLHINKTLASEFKLDISYLEQQGHLIFSGNQISNNANPIAQVYAGHQFGHFVPQLGDGRAILLGEMYHQENKPYDLQLKGSGKTSFSRQGDGRSALGPVLREYIVSEAMSHLGIPTTRSLAIVTTGEPVFRETILPGAILTRIASSYIRIGTFEYFSARKDLKSVQLLADYVIERHYPHLKSKESPYILLLEEISKAQAELVSKWMQVGFIHGVMNTDNMAVSGETIDYGPCAFMDVYHPNTVFSSIDYQGRYAYQNQGRIAQWNLASLANCLLPLIHSNIEQATEMVKYVIESFAETFQAKHSKNMFEKIGIQNIQKEDGKLLQNLLDWMQTNEIDYTCLFRLLSNNLQKEDILDELHSMILSDSEFIAWSEVWKDRLQQEEEPLENIYENMKSVNPAYIPRNHIVEQIIQEVTKKQDMNVMNNWMKVLSNPYQEQKSNPKYIKPPLPEEKVLQTFCGT